MISSTELLAEAAQHGPARMMGRPPLVAEVMRRIHLLKQLFGHSDPSVEAVLHDIALNREFTRLDAGITRLPGQRTFRVTGIYSKCTASVRTC